MIRAIITFILITAGICRVSPAQSETKQTSTVEAHIKDVVKELPADSRLRQALLQGTRGSGVHESWMDEMRAQGFKRVDVWIDISFDRRGRPKTMSVNRVEFFTQYEDGVPVSDSKRMDKARLSGLEKEMSTLALERAARGFWPDVPRPKPHPFVGGTHVEFLDDEWLPSLTTPVYYARYSK